MSKHRKGWTIPQAILGVLCAVIGAAITVLGFIDIFLTVTHLLSPEWGMWSWTVIVLGEGSFLGSYLGWLLLDLKDKPPQRIRLFLAAYLSLFALGSLALNLYAGRGSIPGLISHAIVVGAFFGYGIFVKILVKRLSVTDEERDLASALADARQYAIDLVRDRKGSLWRWRVPTLLKRQILSGRLPDEVREKVGECVRFGKTSGWNEAVRDWVFGADGLNLKALADMADKKALAGIHESASESASGGGSRSDSEGASGSAHERASGDGSGGTSGESVRSASRRPRRINPAKASDDQLLAIVMPLFDGGEEVNKYRILKAIKAECGGRGVGDDRAGRLLELAERQHRARRVVPIEEGWR